MAMGSAFSSLLALALFIPPLGAQPQPVSPLRPQDACRLEGKVVNSVTGQPVRGATLRILQTTPLAGAARGTRTASFSTTSDGEGNFAMKDLPPGEYRVMAQRTGFTTASGQRGGGTLVKLAPGQRLTGLEVKLEPLAIITGRVVDDQGEPVVSASVTAMLYRYVSGRRQLMPGAGASTNDLGEYRIFGLQPGRYYIRALSRANAPFQSGSEDRSANPQPEEAVVPTYFPGTPDMRAATQVEAAAGALVQNIDFRLLKLPAVRVRGRLMNLPAVTNLFIQVMLTANDEQGGALVDRKSTMAPQGQFEFQGVTAGRYTLTASATDKGKRFHGQQVVDVGSTNVDNASVALSAGFDQPGTIRLDSQAVVTPTGLSVSLQSVDPDIPAPFAQASADGNFVLANVMPGRYLLNVSLRAGLYLKSAQLGEQDVLETPLDLTGGSAGALRILLGTSPGELSGAVTGQDLNPASGAWVVLIPEAAKRRAMAQFYRQTTTSNAGRYSLSNVPPGRYKLFAWEQIENSAWMDPDVLKPVESKGIAVDVKEGGKETVDLKVIPASP